MLAKKILSNLENGNYRIEYREKCDCGFNWYVKDNEYVCDTVNNGGCYHENVLIMDDLAGQFDDVLIVDCDGVIATYDVYYGVTLQIICLRHAVVNKILKLLQDSDAGFKIRTGLSTPGTKNELHEKRKIKSLLNYIGWKGD